MLSTAKFERTQIFPDVPYATLRQCTSSREHEQKLYFLKNRPNTEMVTVIELPAKGESEAVDFDADFQWIDCSLPGNVKTAKNRHIIHRHSMKDVGKARRKHPRKRKVERVLLNLSALEPVDQLPNRIDQETPSHPALWLGSAAGMDPFIRYPIELDSAAKELLATGSFSSRNVQVGDMQGSKGPDRFDGPNSANPTNCNAVFRDDGGLQRPLRDAWFAVGLADEAAFLQVLSNSALHLDTMRHGGRRPRESPISIYYQLRTIKSINDRLQDDSTFVSDASIGAVAALLVHDEIIGVFEGWTKHHKGLEQMIKLRGGIKSIDGNAMLRVTVSWVELRGAFQQDIEPVFLIPDQWTEQIILPSLPYDELLHSKALRRTWAQEMPGLPAWINIYELLVLFSRDSFPAWSDEALFGSATLQQPHTGAWSNPIMYQLLKFRPLQQSEISIQSLIQEVCRLGSLLYLCFVWRIFGVHPVRPDIYIRKLHNTLATHEIEWSKLWKLKLWALSMGAMEALLFENERLWFMKEIAVTLEEHGIKSWNQGLLYLKEILWFDTIFGGKDVVLFLEVEKLFKRAT